MHHPLVACSCSDDLFRVWKSSLGSSRDIGHRQQKGCRLALIGYGNLRYGIFRLARGEA